MKPPQKSERFSAFYDVVVRDGRPVEEHALDIALEQTVEVPPEAIPSGHVEAGFPGRVENVETLPGQPLKFRIEISYRCDATAFSIPQLFNLLYGNISLKDHIRLVDLNIPRSLLEAFGGPRYGVPGLRRLCGVFDRPLACTALKPMGLPVAELARIAEAFARGGADLIKDDHGLSDQRYHPFEERVARCQDAVAAVNARTGRRTLYFPMLNGGLDDIDRQARFAVRQGIKGVLIAPMLSGPDAGRFLSQNFGLAVMAHPALTGTFFHDRGHGMSPGVLLGTLFRLIGADVSIFPNSGGRFHFQPGECSEIASALRKPLGRLLPSFPCPAGGMSLERVAQMGETFGGDTVFLIGGDVLRRKSIEKYTGQFMDRIRARFPERLERPPQDGATACEWRGSDDGGKVMDILTFSNFRWEGRSTEAYKADGECDFKGVMRQELTGRFGERTAFDLRYFEIEPGGFSSFEKHVHEHVIIGVRGRGLLVKGERKLAIGVNDIAYVKPLEPHQLHNTEGEPFGFYCVVDHERDRPQKV